MHKQIVLSLTLVLVAGLAACAKPSDLRSKSFGTEPSTSSDPKRAEKENKEADAADAKRLAEAAEKPLTDEEKAELAKKQQNRDASLDRLGKDMGQLMDQAKQSGGPSDSTGAPPATTEGAATSGTTPNTTQTDSSTGTTDAATTTGGTAPKTDTPASDTTAAGTATAQSAPTAPPADEGVDTEQTVRTRQRKNNFVLELLETNMRANYQFGIQRNEILGIQAKLLKKQGLTDSEAQRFLKLRTEYGVPRESTDPMADLLSRVQNVSYQVAIAEVAQKTDFGLYGDLTKEKIAERLTNRMRELNVSPEADAVRYRQARATSSNPINQLMALVGKRADAKAVVDTAIEVYHILNSSGAFQAEITRVGTNLRKEGLERALGSTPAAAPSGPALKADEATAVPSAEVKSSPIGRVIRPAPGTSTAPSASSVTASAPAVSASAASQPAASASSAK